MGSTFWEDKLPISVKILKVNSLCPNTSVLRNLSYRTGNPSTERYMYMIFHWDNLYDFKNWKSPKCPSLGDWLNILWYFHFMKNTAIKNKSFT